MHYNTHYDNLFKALYIKYKIKKMYKLHSFVQYRNHYAYLESPHKT